MTDLRPARTMEETDLTLFGPGHVRVYQETNGERGYLWNGAPILLLTTKGRSSGQERITPLIFVEDGDHPVIIASKGGAPDHPAWYKNLVAEPRVRVQIKGEVFDAVARTVGGADRARIWPRAVEAWPQYADYQKATDREIPVVALERVRS
jgi:deazaflavin-dependent oxidoreductase (nitroreductase family)